LANKLFQDRTERFSYPKCVGRAAALYTRFLGHFTLDQVQMIASSFTTPDVRVP